MNLIKWLFMALVLVSGATQLHAQTININTADAQTLATRLNGIGPSKAQAIVAYREQHGPFKSIEQLAEVKGIGLKTVEQNKELVSVGNAAPLASVPPTTQPKAGAPSNP